MSSETKTVSSSSTQTQSEKGSSVVDLTTGKHQCPFRCSKPGDGYLLYLVVVLSIEINFDFFVFPLNGESGNTVKRRLENSIRKTLSDKRDLDRGLEIPEPIKEILTRLREFIDSEDGKSAKELLIQQEGNKLIVACR